MEGHAAIFAHATDSRGAATVRQTTQAARPPAVERPGISDSKAAMFSSSIPRRPSTLVAALVIAAVVPLGAAGSAAAEPAGPAYRGHRVSHAAGHHVSPKAAWLRHVSRTLSDVHPYLDARARGGGRLALVLGIDDVALATRYDWPKGVAPTLQVARHARRLGIAVFFVTGRFSSDLHRLTGPLRRAGFVWNGICGRRHGVRVPAAKARCRRSIEGQGYTITANISSNRQAFHGGFYERAVLLPNIGRRG
jgi:hypothetical protein